MRSSREAVLINRGSGLVFPRRGITPNLLPTIDMGLDTCDTIESGSNVETEHGATIGGRGGGGKVVVDYVSDFFAYLLAVDNPVASVEWRLGAI